MRVGIVITICLLCLYTVGCKSSPPTEPDIRSFFERNRSNLQRILEMSDEDYSKAKVTRIAPSFTRLEDNWGWPRPESEWGISASRWDEYRKLFKEVGLADGIDREKEHVRFPKWGYGLADNSHEIGVVFEPGSPKDISGKSQTFSYQNLSGDWYYYEWRTW